MIIDREKINANMWLGLSEVGMAFFLGFGMSSDSEAMRETFKSLPPAAVIAAIALMTYDGIIRFVSGGRASAIDMVKDVFSK